MGFHVEGGSDCMTPVVWFNHCGVAGDWCAKAAAQLSEREAWEMRQFTASFAFSEGMTHPNRPWELFEPQLLFGEPRKLWDRAFLLGTQFAAKDRNAEAHPRYDPTIVLEQVGFFDFDPIEEAVWQSLDAALDRLDGDFRAAYQRLGLTARSNFAGLRTALDGWFNPSTDTFISALFVGMEDEPQRPSHSDLAGWLA